VPPQPDGLYYPFLSYGDDGVSGTNAAGKQLWVDLLNGQLSFDTPYNAYRWSGDRTAQIWQHIAVTITSNVVTAFVNGVSVGNGIPQDPSVQIDTNTNTDLLIGGYRDWGYSGAIDDLRIYSRAMTSNEVSQLYQYESPNCSPYGATATAIVTNGFVVGAIITDRGCGYTNAPLVLIEGGGGSGAGATAAILDGHVVSINITNAGCCYTNLPRIVIASPPFEPTVTIAVSRVNVIQHVVLGRTYVLESSTDLVNWTATAPPFTAQSEQIITEFVVSQSPQFFRIRQVQ
jgi:hypothetical protein